MITCVQIFGGIYLLNCARYVLVWSVGGSLWKSAPSLLRLLKLFLVELLAGLRADLCREAAKWHQFIVLTDYSRGWFVHAAVCSSSGTVH